MEIRKAERLRIPLHIFLNRLVVKLRKRFYNVGSICAERAINKYFYGRKHSLAFHFVKCVNKFLRAPKAKCRNDKLAFVFYASLVYNFAKANLIGVNIAVKSVAVSAFCNNHFCLRKRFPTL